MKVHFEQFAGYNRWANARLYQAALALDEAAYGRDIGLFFRSLSGTLNHLLVADRIWMKRLTGAGEAPSRLDSTIHADRRELARARAAEDDRIVAYVAGLDEAALTGLLEYKTTSGTPFTQQRSHILAHLFNHQTHHRGQAHTALSILTGSEPPVLDLLAYQRGAPAPDLATLADAC